MLRDGAESPAKTGWPEVVTLAASGAALILAVPQDSLPYVVHWGADPGPQTDTGLHALAVSAIPPRATNGVDTPVVVSILPEGRTGWAGTPGVSGHRSGTSWSPWLRPQRVDVSTIPGEGGHVEIVAADAVAGLEVGLRVEMLETGLVRMQAGVTNTGTGTYTVDAVSLALPVPTRADDLWDFAGRWSKEKVVQRRPFTVGSHVREGRHGRTGADAATLLMAGTADLGFAGGEAWGLHVAFSGNHRVIGERAHSGERLLLGGELLLPGEVELRTGETYETPKIFAVYGAGLDDVASRLHRYLRARPHHPRSPRPVVMNVWEAVYFEHDVEQLVELAALAADVGVERFVLDDGWFGGRRDETSGLGDWVVSSEVWGEGRFRVLVDAVKNRGMQFGLWFEPEMISLDSEIARAHPEWILQVPGRMPVEFRRQQVLDLTHPGAFEHVRDQILALVHEYGIDYIKWDHNRDLIDAGSTLTGRAGVHRQTLATYRLLDAIRSKAPGLEIESCSSGGARIDLEIIDHTDRVWASDCIDAHERQQIQRWTAQLLPPELVGSHIGADRAHTTGRRLDLDFRAATALFGHFGVEWDLRATTAADRAELAAWVSFYKRMRPLIHTGTVVRRDAEQGDLWLHGAVSPDQREALYAVTLRERHVTWPSGRVQLPGLRRDLTYRVQAAGPGSDAPPDERVHPSWWGHGIELSGAVLGDVGVHVPALDPDHSALLHVEATYR
ncbi:alpha-galactosidase [Nocardioides luteus]|uniref:alpha-galactosidase n=1 Tax=Nocardioides luteus TaxID=1844 RepID=UPI0018C93342|nr:alpha-galactosidase [Nocardioides luteus]